MGGGKAAAENGEENTGHERPHGGDFGHDFGV